MGVLSITGLNQLFTFQTPPLAPQENGLTTTENHLPETHPSIRSWLKRGLDIVGGIVGLLITGFIFVPIAIAIKLDSPGPIFSVKPAAVGWESNLRFSNFVPCVWMPKHSRIKSPIKRRELFLRIK
ncbi:MAG UNVERIFIED_CONTAM: hypothetical protein LVR29_27490 [Microcystis novacekii LVE1205-3]|jgi:hypothetical protein